MKLNLYNATQVLENTIFLKLTTTVFTGDGDLLLLTA